MSEQVKISNGTNPIVHTSNFYISENKINVIFGESGIGKSLLSKTLFGLLKSSDLEVSINGRPYSDYIQESETYKKALDGFYVFQEPSSYLNPLMTIEEQINEGVLSDSSLNEQIFSKLWDNSDWRKLLNIYPKDHRPSGGEKQRIYNLFALKKMLLKQNGFFVFDEPTGNLDEYHRDRFLDALLTIYNEYEHTIILITHDYSIIDYFSSHPLKLSKKN